MKKSILIAFTSGMLVFGIVSFKSSKSTGEKNLAKVYEVEGKPVFAFSAPTQAYETAFEFETRVGGMGCPSIEDFAKGAVKSALKKGLPFDAIILGNTKKDLAIKFK